MKEKYLIGRDFENFFREYFRSLTVYAMQFVNDQGIAEDIVQDLYLNLYEKRESNQGKTITRNYLYKSVYNRCLNYLEFQKKRVENIQAVRDSLVSNPSDPLEIVAFVEFEHKFLQILEMLSPKCRKIFEMSRIEHKKNQEIAKELKLSKRTVETHITRALRIMRKKLCKYLPIALIVFFFKAFFLTCGFIFNCY